MPHSGVPTTAMGRISNFAPSFANRYKVELPTKYGLTIHQTELLCDAATLPGRNISTSEYPNGSQLKKYPYSYIEDDVTMTFLETKDYIIRKYFDNWMKNIIDTDTYRVGYKNSFAHDIKIRPLSRKGEHVYGVNLEQAFPTTLNAVDFSNGADEIVRITVTFAYDRYTILPKST